MPHSLKWILCFFVFQPAISEWFLNAQALSRQELKPYVALWKSGRIDTVAKDLPALKTKYPEAPEVLFLGAAMNENGTRAYDFYKRFIVNYPTNVFADECLYKIIQYEVSLGLYATAQKNLNLLKSKYRESEFIKPASLLFPDADDTVSTENTSDEGVVVKETAYTVQLGAFSDKKNAEQMKVSLQNKGYKNIEIKIRTEKEKTLYLVWMGSYPSKEEAARSAASLKIPYTITTK